MGDRIGDWLDVVFGAGLDVTRANRASAATEIVVRHSLDQDVLSARGERRVRVTVAPSDPGQRWRLYLTDYGAGAGLGRGGRVWWRAEPGTWQPLGGSRQCLAEGRGRERVDVWIRVGDSVIAARDPGTAEPQSGRGGRRGPVRPESAGAAPALAFVAEAA